VGVSREKKINQRTFVKYPDKFMRLLFDGLLLTGSTSSESALKAGIRGRSGHIRVTGMAEQAR
jgi:hypothetical protein